MKIEKRIVLDENEKEIINDILDLRIKMEEIRCKNISCDMCPLYNPIQKSCYLSIFTNDIGEIEDALRRNFVVFTINK